MDYTTDVIPLLKKLVGCKLKSISGKADITVVSVTDTGYSVQCSDGKLFEETHRRAEVIFEQLLKDSIVHADAALKNGGSRRNVPETLIANIPFVEHGKINNRKHLYLVDTETHQLGSLKEK